MKSKLITTAVLLIGLAACNQTNHQEGTSKDSLLINTTTDSFTLNENVQCYTASLKNDSAFLSLKSTDGKIEGKLWNKFYEKDNSKGTLSGTIENDTLKLNYTFNAEGSTSERPIKLLIKGDKIYEVYGNEVAEEGKGFVFVKSDCREF
ncbi:MAG: hypothetical protein KKE39_06370 [Bacteroidetes bacterium]|nr:hypothetical protein [Bacteroidota bacterium]MBU1372265.1 hypothetical protein [Bacteroidota bacterium]MBU1486028.1 hypothetical protein [Bacteroidota bacterium]MBU1759808.1 hypothetical protein [Bacteroidota bacterium]MBU2045498.1 hypothetical protein [Bacteroidota bacterium]